MQMVHIRISRYGEWMKWCVVLEPDDGRQGKGKKQSGS